MLPKRPPLHTGAADSGHTHKVPQLNKQGALRGPWGRRAGWWVGLWRSLRWVKLPLLIKQARDDGIRFFIRRGRPFPASPVSPLDRHCARPTHTIGGLCPRPLVATPVPVTAENTLTAPSSSYRNLLSRCISRMLFELAWAHLEV